MYLDEYVEALLNETGLLFSPSVVQRNLAWLGISLVVIQEKVREADAAH